MNLTLIGKAGGDGVHLPSFTFKVPDRNDIDHVTVIIWSATQTTCGIHYENGSSFVPTENTFKQGGIEFPECKDEDGARKVAEAVVQLSNMGNGNPFGEVVDANQDKA
jgi:hypothetical protein